MSEADRVRREVAVRSTEAEKEKLGQFLTPRDVAQFIAAMFDEVNGERIRLVDPGAGVGSLTAAVVDELCRRSSRPCELHATAFEIDDRVIDELRHVVSRSTRAASEAGLKVAARICHEDFLAEACRSIADASLRFELAVMNPPYRKIRAGSREREVLQAVGLDATNLYAAFVAVTIRLLVEGGQLVAIIPRSFCNGPYFRSFRDLLLAETCIRRIHSFDSRSSSFREDGVLQENIILHLVKGRTRQSTITISSSEHAGAPVTTRDLPYAEVIRAAGNDRFIHLPAAENQGKPSKWVASQPCTLEDLGIRVSTGRVVDFRAREHLRPKPSGHTVPLIYPCHFDDGRVLWPNERSKKPNAIFRCAETETLLIPNGYYVFTKRFTSKEEKRRLVAVVHDPCSVDAPVLGVENHVNYFHTHGEPLEPEIAYGLCAYLNSTPLDQYFREFNGHTQVNATDLRSIRYPTKGTLKKIGRSLSSRKVRNLAMMEKLFLQEVRFTP